MIHCSSYEALKDCWLNEPYFNIMLFKREKEIYVTNKTRTSFFHFFFLLSKLKVGFLNLKTHYGRKFFRITSWCRFCSDSKM